MLPSPPPPGPVAALRRLLEAADFTERGVCGRLDLPGIHAFQPGGRIDGAGHEPGDLLDLLVVLFLEGVTADRRVVDRLLPTDARSALDALDLLTHLDDGRCHATVALYPTGSLHLVSDSPIDPLTGRGRELARDAVYPAITWATRDFVTVLPPTPRGRFLELCSGTGIGALSAARSADHAWAVDITERSTRFATFNAALNDVENITILQGDLYEPVEGRSFDTIVAHPPYMQSDEVKEIYRDGGPDGEVVTRRILAGLGRHLVPGGRFHCTCLLTEREGSEVEDRIREMLGAEADDFDVLLMPIRSMDPRKSIFEEAVKGRATLEESRRREALYSELGVKGLVYSSMALHRKTEARPARTFRRPRRPETTGAAVEWLLDWELEPRVRLDAAALAEATPEAPDWVGARSELSLEAGRWHPVGMSLTTPWPFPATVRCAPWVLELVARCDGGRTVRHLLESLRSEGLISRDAPESGLLEMIRSLVSAGVLSVPSHPLPPRPTRTEGMPDTRTTPRARRDAAP